MTEQREPCRYCGRPLKRLYPEARFELQWGHTNAEDAYRCPIVAEWDRWPLPAEGYGSLHKTASSLAEERGESLWPVGGSSD